MTKRALLAFALASFATGCGQEPTEILQTSASAIVDAEPSGAEQDGVVLLRAMTDQGETLCSASLVAPNLVVTARHCVSYVTPGPFQCSPSGEPIELPEGGTLGLHLPATSLEIYGGDPPRRAPLARGMQIFSTLTPTICVNDIAFVVLDGAIDAPIVPVRLDRPAERGEASVLVGYGVSKEGQSIDYQRQKRAQKRGLSIAAVGPDSAADGVASVPPRSLLLRGPSGCVGDSGGPLLAESTGALLGVYSLLEGTGCDDPNARHHFTHVPAFRQLIDEAFAAAGQEPLPEPAIEPGAAGASGQGGDTSTAGRSTADDTPTESAAGGASAEAVPSSTQKKATSGCQFSPPAPPPGGSSSLLLLALCSRRFRWRHRSRRICATSEPTGAPD